MAIESLIIQFGPINEIEMNETQKSLGVVVCLRCSRPLTNEKSRMARLGPKCARKLAYETRAHSYSLKTLKYQQQSLSQYIPLCPSSIPTQQIVLYYTQNSSQKPYCKIGTLALSATDTATDDGYRHRKQLYQLPLLEGIRYQLFEPLPRPRVFYLQVQDQQLKDITHSIH